MKQRLHLRKKALIAITVICLALFTTILVFHERLALIDAAANKLLNGYGTFFYSIASVISFLGSIYVVPVIFIIVLFLLWQRKKQREALILGIAVLSNYAVVNIVKVLTGWVRPSEVQRAIEQTFPSAHASTPFVLYVLAYLFLVKQPKKSTFVAIVALCLLIGFSRIIVNAHWMTDVIAGILLAIAWISATLLFYKK